MSTIADARKAATEAGIVPEDQTPEVLKRFGAVINTRILPDSFQPGPANTRQEVREQIALVIQEAEENEAAGNIANIVLNGFERVLNIVSPGW